MAWRFTHHIDRWLWPHCFTLWCNSSSDLRACVCVRTRNNWFLLTQVNLGIWNVERSQPAAWSVFLLLNAPQCFLCICLTKPLNAKTELACFTVNIRINPSIHPNLTHLSTSWRQLQKGKAGKSDSVHIFKLLPQITWHSLAGKKHYMYQDVCTTSTDSEVSYPFSQKVVFIFILFFFFYQAQLNAQSQKSPHQSGIKQQVATASTLLLTQRTRTTKLVLIAW